MSWGRFGSGFDCRRRWKIAGMEARRVGVGATALAGSGGTRRRGGGRWSRRAAVAHCWRRWGVRSWASGSVFLSPVPIRVNWNNRTACSIRFN